MMNIRGTGYTNVSTRNGHNSTYISYWMIAEHYYNIDLSVKNKSLAVCDLQKVKCIL